MTKKLLLSIALLCAFGQMAWAQNSIEVYNEDELRSAVTNDSVFIILYDDITLTNTLNITGVTIAIDLSGHTLSRGLTASAGDNGHVIKVNSNANVTIFATDGGTITGGYADKGGAIWNSGTLVINDCLVTNNTANDVGGLYNTQGGTATINYCTFTSNHGTTGCGAIGNATDANNMEINCSVIKGNTGGTNGGGIWNGSVIHLYNDSINNNTASMQGGGIFNKGTFEGHNSSVSNNTAHDVGGFYNTQGGTAFISGCVFIGNQGTGGCGAIGNATDAGEMNIEDTSINSNSGGTNGGGIWNGSTLALDGVAIQNNSTTNNGSGIYNRGTLQMKGTILVKDNTNDDIYLCEGYKITINDVLTGWGNTIGVKMQTPDVFTVGYAAHNSETNHFFSSGTVDGIELIDGEGKMFYGYYECSWDSENKEVVHTVKHVPANVAVDNICSEKYTAHGGDLWGDQYWFVAEGTGSTATGLTCGNSEVHLILRDGAQITINEGFYVNSGTTLHIYCQSYGDRMGKLISNNDKTSQPGIGPKHDGSCAGNIDIHGGDIKATGGEYAAGIGGCEDRSSGIITIWDGKIDATGGTDAAGIGGGEGGSSDDILIYGGDIKAVGTEYGAGIGSGEYSGGGGECHRIEIFGGKIEATGGGQNAGGLSTDSGAGIGTGGDGTLTGPIVIWGGEVNARGGFCAAGIGGGERCPGGPITINGGVVTAYAGFYGAAIGGGWCEDDTGGTITINGGVVTALARNDWGQSSCSAGAGIGGGCNTTGGSITINDGIVIATSEKGAAIGGGANRSGGTTVINGGSVVAVSLASGAGIGGGHYMHGGNITITGGEVMAIGGANKVSYSGNPVNTLSHIFKFLTRLRSSSMSSSLISTCLVAGSHSIGHLISDLIIGDTWGGAGIGGGYNGNGGTINITGGFVVAQSGHSDSDAIGKGYTGDNSGTLSLYSGATVSSGSDEEHYSQQQKDQREWACRSRFAIIRPCGHKNAQSYTDNGDGTYTANNNGGGCQYCGLVGTHTCDHTFDADGAWNDVNCWNSGHVPAAGNSVIIAAKCDIPSDYLAEANAVNIPYYDTLTIKDGGQLIHSNEGVVAWMEKNIEAWTVAQNYDNVLTDRWYFISTPFAEGYAPDEIMLSNTYDLYRLNSTSWENFKNTSEHPDFTTLDNGKGYLYANSNAVKLVLADELKPYNEIDCANRVDVNAGFNLVGNPFACNVYANRVYYKMNADGTGVMAVEDYQNNTIKPCTGIVIYAENDGQVAFTKNPPVHSSNNNGSLQIYLAQVGGERSTSTGSVTILDNAIVTFNEGSELGKFYFGTQDANIYIPQGTEEYAIVYSNKQGEMPLNFKASKNGEYTLSINPKSVEMEYLHLIDNMTGADVDLLSAGDRGSESVMTDRGVSYSFTAKTTDYESRFKLVFSICGDANGDNDGDNASFAFIHNREIIITADADDATLQVIDMMGHILVSVDGRTRSVPTAGLVSGVYVLRLISGDRVKTQKMVIGQ